MLTTNRCDLRAYQQKAVEKLLPRDGGMLAMEPGLGKSRTAIALAQEWEATRIVVLCPVNALGVWLSELEKWANAAVYIPVGTINEITEDINELQMAFQPRREVAHTTVQQEVLPTESGQNSPLTETVETRTSELRQELSAPTPTDTRRDACSDQDGEGMLRLWLQPESGGSRFRSPSRNEEAFLYKQESQSPVEGDLGRNRKMRGGVCQLPSNSDSAPSQLWIILNYDKVIKRDRKWAIMDSLLRLHPDLLIADESQYLKTTSSLRTKAAWKLSKAATHTVVLSGTPITKSPLDLYAQLRAVNPEIWANGDGKVPAFSTWKYQYGIFGGFGGYQLVGLRNLDDFRRRISPYVYVQTKAEVMPELPPITDRTVPMYAEHLKTYQAVAALESNPLTRALRLQQHSGIEKLPVTIGLALELLDQGQRVVIFYRFTEEGHHLWATLKGWRIAGDVNSTDRIRDVGNWKVQTEHPLLVQIQAGATAIDLSAGSHLIFHSLTWDFGEYQQARDRLHRWGQENPVTAHHVVLRGPQGGRLVDDLILEALRYKRDVAQMILADPSLLELEVSRA